MADPAGAAHLVVTGPMGVGKTTLADRLAIAVGRQARDSDRDIEALFGRPGRAIAADEGVDALHRLEVAVLLRALASPIPLVIAAAGWVVEDEQCRAAMARRATVVVLDLPNEELMARLTAAGDGHRRPMDVAEVEALARRRRPLYEAVADVRLDGRLAPAQLVDRALAALADAGDGERSG